MIGAIAGDIIGSVYEWNNIKTKDFTLFAQNAHYTDDTVLTVALADSILTGTPYAENLRRFYHWYPGAGYGGSFHLWANNPDAGPYNSWGNGAAMRCRHHIRASPQSPPARCQKAERQHGEQDAQKSCSRVELGDQVPWPAQDKPLSHRQVPGRASPQAYSHRGRFLESI
ncbi:ADP-ribosylglycohydrolase family protein [Desulfonatronum thioautotrophicum]|uniref:ADP-ribosylglycohydrolase family protein n=1 Tax=Desulfonatronum thioautotrophicum TaxID=617001 RepID=UPI000AE399C8|nr:ADP-ribosylglycohydrolase family protein [Desulfonatronum thioautotrophicum]